MTATKTIDLLAPHVRKALRDDLRYLAANATFLTFRKRNDEIIDIALVANLSLAALRAMEASNGQGDNP